MQHRSYFVIISIILAASMLAMNVSAFTTFNVDDEVIAMMLAWDSFPYNMAHVVNTNSYHGVLKATDVIFTNEYISGSWNGLVNSRWRFNTISTGTTLINRIPVIASEACTYVVALTDTWSNGYARNRSGVSLGALTPTQIGEFTCTNTSGAVMNGSPVDLTETLSNSMYVYEIDVPAGTYYLEISVSCSVATRTIHGFGIVGISTSSGSDALMQEYIEYLTVITEEDMAILDAIEEGKSAAEIRKDEVDSVLDAVDRPSADSLPGADAAGMVEFDSSEGASYIRSFMENQYILTILLFVFSLASISYVLYGKRDG